MENLQPIVYKVRSAKIEDANEVTDLIIASDIAEYGVPDCSIEDVLEIWGDIPIETNTWIIENEDRIVGYGFLEERSKGRIDSCGFVHPGWYGNGIGSLLVDNFEKRAISYISQYKEEGIDYEFNSFVPAKNDSALSLFENRGFKLDKVYSRMIIELTAEQAITAIAEDVSILPFDMDRDALGLFDAYVESFRDTRSFYPEQFENWIQKKTTELYDQQLWHVAYVQEELVGFTVCKTFPEGTYVELLGVKRSGRKKGIGADLLKSVFNKSYEKGINAVLLSVDANSLTNANRLYERVGMKATFQTACYKKQE